MSADSTYIVNFLDYEVIKSINDEINNISESLWSAHVPPNRGTALNDGQTIYLNWIKTPRIPEYMPSYPELFPLLINFLKETIRPYSLGKAFIHRLNPGDTIYRHNDIKIIEQTGLLNRYHLYLDIPDEMIIEFDGKIISNLNKFSNTLVNFALKRMHSYNNCTDKKFIFIVFDQCDVNLLNNINES